MPYSVIMPRAIAVAFSMSLAAPVVGLVEDELLRGPATEQHRQLVHHLGAAARYLSSVGSSSV